MATAITGPLYHERMITGILVRLRDGIDLPAEQKAGFYIAYTSGSWAWTGSFRRIIPIAVKR